jgi:hypothetical protein
MRDYTSCCLYTVDPPHVEQQACSKHVEAYYWNKLIENSASCWFILYENWTNFLRTIVFSSHVLGKSTDLPKYKASLAVR